MRKHLPFLLALSLFFFSAMPLSQAEEGKVYTITIKDHRFNPAEVKVPSGQKFKLVVKNADSTAEEFESHDLHKEKIIPGGKEASFTIRPLQKGTYQFFGEFHMDTAQGRLIAE